MTSILLLASQISSKRKNINPIYFVVSKKWNQLNQKERIRFNQILLIFSIYVRFSDDMIDEETLIPSEYITKVDGDIWSILEIQEPSYIKHDIYVDFERIYESLKREEDIV
jgi:hypothetical protein